MANNENLKPQPFKDGFDPRRNIKGRPPKSITDFLREYGNATKIDGTVNITKANGEVYQKVIKLESDKSVNELVGISLIEAAISGDLASQKELLDRTEGKAKQELRIESENTNFTPENKLDYSKLNKEQLLELRELKLKALEIEKQCVTE